MMHAGLFRNHDGSKVWIVIAGRLCLLDGVNSWCFGRDFSFFRVWLLRRVVEVLIMHQSLIINTLNDCFFDPVGMNDCCCWYSTFECLSVPCLSLSWAILSLMTFWSIRGWAASWVCCGDSSMNYVEVGFNSWWFVFSSPPLYLCGLARTEVDFAAELI